MQLFRILASSHHLCELRPFHKCDLFDRSAMPFAMLLLAGCVSFDQQEALRADADSCCYSVFSATVSINSKTLSGSPARLHETLQANDVFVVQVFARPLFGHVHLRM